MVVPGSGAGAELGTGARGATAAPRERPRAGEEASESIPAPGLACAWRQNKFLLQYPLVSSSVSRLPTSGSIQRRWIDAAKAIIYQRSCKQHQHPRDRARHGISCGSASRHPLVWPSRLSPGATRPEDVTRMGREGQRAALGATSPPWVSVAPVRVSRCRFQLRGCFEAKHTATGKSISPGELAAGGGRGQL